MTFNETMTAASVVSGVVTLAFVIGGGIRRMKAANHLLRRYQARAHRSVPLSELDPDPWADRPYGTYRPEDIGT